MIAREIIDMETKESFRFKEPYAFSTLDGRVPVRFAGQSIDGDIYETVHGTHFLVRYGATEAECLG